MSRLETAISIHQEVCICLTNRSQELLILNLTTSLYLQTNPSKALLSDTKALEGCGNGILSSLNGISFEPGRAINTQVLASFIIECFVLG